MVKIFLDSNIVVSYFTKRDQSQFEIVTSVIDKIRLGKIIPYTSAIVFLEIFYVMVSVYKYDKKLVLEALNKFMRLRNLVMIEKTDVDLSLEYCKKYNIKLSDCFIAAQVPEGVKLFTFDREFGKIPFLELVHLNEIIGTT